MQRTENTDERITMSTTEQIAAALGADRTVTGYRRITADADRFAVIFTRDTNGVKVTYSGVLDVAERDGLTDVAELRDVTIRAQANRLEELQAAALAEAGR